MTEIFNIKNMSCEKFIPRIVERIFGRNVTESKQTSDELRSASGEHLKLQKVAKPTYFTGEECQLERQVVNHSIYGNDYVNG